MNAFTKDELIMILTLVDSYQQVLKKSGIPVNEEDLIIQRKIKYMIDNYCEPVCPDCGEAACFKFYKCRKNNE